MDVNLSITCAKPCPLLAINCNLALRVFLIRETELGNNRITVFACNLACCRIKFTIDRPYAVLLECLPIKPFYTCKLLFYIVFSILKVPGLFHALTAVRVYLINYHLTNLSELYCLSKWFYNRLSKS